MVPEVQGWATCLIDRRRRYGRVEIRRSDETNHWNHAGQLLNAPIRCGLPGNVAVVNAVSTVVVLGAGLRWFFVGVTVSVTAIGIVMMACSKRRGLSFMMVVLVMQERTEEMLGEYCDEHQARNNCHAL